MMRDPIVIVGSGASAVHFAAEAVARGRRVLMVDVGREPLPVPHPTASFRTLKQSLEDPIEYFLGRDRSALILPGHDEEYYGFPPAKERVFAGLDGVDLRAEGFSPLVSFAKGGLAEAWTGGCYPFDARDLESFPFPVEELQAAYDAVASRIGVSGAADEMRRFFPLHEALDPPVEATPHAARLLAAYEREKEGLAARERFYMGRARLAVSTKDRDGRLGCRRLARCLWGCPVDALYVPSLTVDRLRGEPSFEYRPGRFAEAFETDGGGRVRALRLRPLAGGAAERIEVGTLVLAAGTLGTARLLMQSWREGGGGDLELDGLMDNRQVLMPFLSPGMVGRRRPELAYQYHQLALGLDVGGAADYVHGLVTTLETALIHPIVTSLPFGMATALRVFRDIHPALGLLNVNFADRRRADNRLALEPAAEGGRLLVRYRPEPGEAARLAGATRSLRRILRRLGAHAPRAMMRTRPMGASVHYAGTLPMLDAGGPMTTRPDGRLRAFDNLVIADGSTFPFLPAKNLTFTLMANALRLARRLFP